MTTVANILGLRSGSLDRESDDIVLNNGIGIEVELEDVPPLEIPGWNCTEDGSLRNGREFVCSRPFSGIKLKKAILDFCNAIGRVDPNGSWRCSTHVHMDMRDSSVMVLKKTILAFIFYEKVMYGCSGMHRYKSNFAPAMNAVQEQLVLLSELWNMEDDNFLFQLTRRWDKYSCLNMKPLANFGSIELRISEPKWQKENMMMLVNRFLTLKKLASDSPEAESYTEFVDKLWELGIVPMRDFLVRDYVHNEEFLTEGYVNACDVLNLRDGAVVVDRITSSDEAAAGAELNPDMMVRIPNRSHWSSIRNYIRSHVDDEVYTNFSRELQSDVVNMLRIMRRTLENDNEIIYGDLVYVIDILSQSTDGAVSSAGAEVRAQFDRARANEETDF